MKLNQWTVGLAAAGVVSLASVVQADEAKSAVQTALSQTTISGYVDTSAIWKLGTDGVDNANLPGRSFDGASKQDGFNLNVVKLTIEKPVSEGNWAAGYKVDLLFGPDANTLGSISKQALQQQDWNHVAQGSADFAVKNAYVALRAPIGNGLDIKMGVFDTIIGYEVFEAGNNPNYSRSYGFFLEPIIHTGVLATYRVCDAVSVSAGVAQDGATSGSYWGITSGNSINHHGGDHESQKTYMGSIAITLPEKAGALKGSTIYAGVIDTAQDWSTGNMDKVNMYGGITLNTPVKGLTVGASYDYVANGIYDGSYANAVALYLSMQATEKLRINVRGEYASASSGTFYDLENPDNYSNKGSGNNEEFIGVTGTLDYSLWANVVSRLEVRWDHDASGGTPAFGGSGYYGSFNPQKNAVSVALNLIYKF